MSVRIAVVASAFFVGMCVITAGNPVNQTQACCKVVWLFGLPCAQVNKTILTQIKSMAQYKLGTVTPATIEANHTSMNGHVESVTFSMLSTAMDLGCHVGGISASQFWISLFDNGTNYCNLYNVIHGSGLTSSPGYIEYTNEWICLGYTLAPCKV